MHSRAPAIPIYGGPFDGDIAPIAPGAQGFTLGGHCYVLAREDDGSYFWRYTGLRIAGPFVEAV